MGKTTVVVILSVLGIVVVGTAIGLAIYYTVYAENSEITCPSSVNERIRCYPGEKQLTENACKAVGCCWDEATNDENAPPCFYPEESSYNSYSMGEKEDTQNGWKAEIKADKNLPERFDGKTNHIENLQISVEELSSTTLHVKIDDAEKARYEVPITLNDVSESTSPSDSLYEVHYTKSPFSIKIIRKENKITIFDTALSPLIFMDQYIELSTRLPSKNLYGFGEHNHKQFRHNLNWKTWGIFTRDMSPVTEWNLYGAHPFYMCVEDGGAAHGVLLFNSNAMDVTLQPYPALTYRIIGGVLDFYFFMGPSPEGVVQQYTRLVGRPFMPPYWALGFQLSRWEYNSADHVLEVVQEMRDKGMPQDVMYGDIDYMDNKKVFTYNKNNFSNLPEVVENLHAHGQKYIIILDPAIYIEENGSYEPYSSGLEMGIFINVSDGKTPLKGEVWPGPTVYPDYTNPRTENYWTDLCEKFHDIIPFDGLWVDMNEPSNFVPGSSEGCQPNNLNEPPYLPDLAIDNNIYDKTLCMDSKQHWGDHYDVHSLYGHSMSVVTYQTLQKIFPGKRSVVITRSTFPSSSKYSGHWLGDNQSKWENLPWSIVGMLEFSLFGVPYIGADICGFWFNTTEEMCQRWTQLGAFYPFARNHNGPKTFENAQHIDQHPTAFSERMTNSSRDVLLIRYSLLPYLYTLFHDAHVEGSTVVRPLLHEFSDDENTYNIDRQFLWGPAFMITPVMDEGKTQVENAYFPDARWYDYHTEKEEVAHRKRYGNLEAPLDYINLHVRGGYIIPTQEPNTTTHYSRNHSFGLIVALDDNGEALGNLFWDDGETLDTFNEGSYNFFTFRANMSSVSIELDNSGYDMSSSVMDNVIVFGINQRPSVISVDGKLSLGAIKYNETTQTLKLSSISIINLNIFHVIMWA